MSALPQECASPEKRERFVQAIQPRIDRTLDEHEIPKEARVDVLQNTLASAAVYCHRITRPRRQFILLLEGCCRSYLAAQEAAEAAAAEAAKKAQENEATEEDSP